MKSIVKKWNAKPREDCFGFNKRTRQCEAMKETFCRYRLRVLQGGWDIMQRLPGQREYQCMCNMQRTQREVYMMDMAAGNLKCCDVIEYLAKKYDIKGEMWSNGQKGPAAIQAKQEGACIDREEDRATL